MTFRSASEAMIVMLSVVYAMFYLMKTRALRRGTLRASGLHL